MKFDILAIGNADFTGGQGGGGVHVAEVLARLPGHGFEVAYVPHWYSLVEAARNRKKSRTLVETMKVLERRGVFIPAVAYDIIEDDELLDLIAGWLKDDEARAAAGRMPIGLRAITYGGYQLIAKVIKRRRLLDVNAEGLGSALAAVVSGEGVNKVEYLWDFVGEASYFMLGIVKAFRRPLNITFYHSTFYACSKPFEVYRGLYGYKSLRTITALAVPLPCVYRLRAYFMSLASASPRIKMFWDNLGSFTHFKHNIGLTNLKKLIEKSNIHLIYPAHAMDPLALEQRSYRKSDYLLFGGRLNVLKGLHDMLHVLRYLREKTDVKIVFTGHIYEDSLTVLSKLREVYPNVELFGFVKDRRELYRLYSMARALIYPSHMDGYSLTILDSLGTATPVVAYSLPEFVYLYRSLRPVRLVKEFDFRAFANELAKLAEIDNTRELFDDERTQEFIRLHSSWDNVAEQYARVLLKLK